MSESESVCCLPGVITPGIAARYFNMSLTEMATIARVKRLPVFKTESNFFYETESFVRAVKEFIAESAEMDALVQEPALPAFSKTHQAMFPKEKESLHLIRDVFTTFRGDFADYAKSVVFDWQLDLCPIAKMQFLAVLQELGWLTEAGKARFMGLDGARQGGGSHGE